MKLGVIEMRLACQPNLLEIVFGALQDLNPFMAMNILALLVVRRAIVET